MLTGSFVARYTYGCEVHAWLRLSIAWGLVKQLTSKDVAQELTGHSMWAARLQPAMVSRHCR